MDLYANIWPITAAVGLPICRNTQLMLKHIFRTKRKGKGLKMYYTDREETVFILQPENVCGKNDHWARKCPERKG